MSIWYLKMGRENPEFLPINSATHLLAAVTQFPSANWRNMASAVHQSYLSASINSLSTQPVWQHMHCYYHWAVRGLDDWDDLKLSEEKADLSHRQGKTAQCALHPKSINLIRRSQVAFRKIWLNSFVCGFLIPLEQNLSPASKCA